MKLTLELDLNQEEIDALQSRVDIYNKGSGEKPIDINKWIVKYHIGDEVKKLVASQYEQAVTSISEAAKLLPYEERLNLIASVAETISKNQ